MNKIIGSFFNALGKIVEVFFDILIWLANLLTNLSKTISRALGVLLIFGCSAFVFIIPFFLFLDYRVFLGIAVIILFAILGNTAISKLKYYKYISTEYLYDTGNYFKSGKKDIPFRNYQKQYEDLQRENARRRHEEERRAFEEEMKRRQERTRQTYEEFYRHFGGFGNFQDGQWDRTGQSGYNSYNNRSQGQGSTTFAGGFKAQYEEACDILGVDYDADEYDIKLAYRKKAKEYHPDLNPDRDTTQEFQKINSANEFLSEENMARYKRL